MPGGTVGAFTYGSVVVVSAGVMSRGSTTCCNASMAFGTPSRRLSGTILSSS
jgi:hypothetical protein